MKCVWDIVSVHVSLHGISDCRCCYKVSANEFCQRQLWTWWDGQGGDEKLALCSLDRCCIATPASFCSPCLTCAVRVRKNPGLRSIAGSAARGTVICSSTFALFALVPNRIPMCQAGAWHKVILVLPFPRALFVCGDFLDTSLACSMRIKTRNPV